MQRKPASEGRNRHYSPAYQEDIPGKEKAWGGLGPHLRSTAPDNRSYKVKGGENLPRPPKGLSSQLVRQDRKNVAHGPLDGAELGW